MWAAFLHSLQGTASLGLQMCFSEMLSVNLQDALAFLVPFPTDLSGGVHLWY